MFIECACTNMTFQMLIRKTANSVLTWNDFVKKKKKKYGKYVIVECTLSEVFKYFRCTHARTHARRHASIVYITVSNQLK